MLSSCLETTWANICAVGIMDYNFSSWFLQTADVLSEEAILKWYNDAHTAKGKSVFLEQMKKFVEWLKNAEEGKHLKVLFFLPFLSIGNFRATLFMGMGCIDWLM